jgi:hypothetical protein
MTRRGNVVNVDTVETTPTIDNPEDHPTACGDSRFKPLIRLQQAGPCRGASGLAT